MPTRHKILTIDETGKASYNHKSELFILCGLVVKASNAQLLHERVSQIKFKYWGGSKVKLHFKDMDMRSGPFSIFKESATENSFGLT